jgi:hypothetical protein
MGMFDRLWLDCPSCDQLTEFQSKWGECTLADFTLENAPLAVVADAHDEGSKGRLYCEHCRAKLQVSVRFLAETRLATPEPEWREV